ncbi:MAG TPA: DUF1553 domain-containing protein, partial [Planctomycetota bacterium]|nr:DUF1553 domain-containing protein [Planctomycetota bacterium]
LLPDAKRDEKLATAFQRLHRMTNEGGSIAAELRTEYAADRVATFGTAFLGLTLDCARCHDHKFDPISQREYYSLFSYFNSIGEHGLYHDSARVPTPSLLLPDEKQEAQLAELEARVRVADQDLEAALAAAEKRDAMARTRTTLEELQQRIEVEAGAGLVGHFPMEGPSGDAASARELANLVPGRKPGKTSAGNRYCAGKVGQALEFSGDDVASFAELCGALRLDEAFTIAFWYRHAGQVDKAVVLHRSSGTDVGYFGTELSLDKGRLRFAMQRHAPSNAMAVVTRTALRQDTWVHVAITYDARHRARGLRIYLDGRLASEVERDTLTKRPQHGGSGFDFGQRFRDRGPRGDAVDEVRAYERALSGAEVAALAGTLATDARGLDDRSLADFFVDRDAEVTAARARVTAAQRALFELRTGFQEISVMAEAAPREATHVLARGAYDAPRDEASRVARAVPACIAGDVGQDAKAIDDRLALARWLLRDDHPLFARVVVNRFWQDFFGRGIVATADDFGTRGTPPTHPDLLDWLARDFVASGYDVKRLCRSIVLSATYRQNSRAREATRERDADNVWLARYPARRLSAEELRDSALAVAGLLDRSVGGPPVSPYQPKGLWRESNSMSPAYQQSVGTALYRRSLYSVWKRTAPLPNMLLFDAAHRESCVARRGETSTPLQALVLLNDVQFVEAARVFAQRGLAAPSGPDLVEGGLQGLHRAVDHVLPHCAGPRGLALGAELRSHLPPLGLQPVTLRLPEMRDAPEQRGEAR